MPQICVTRELGSAPEAVFDAWLDPASACRWLFKTPTGEMVRVEIDGRVGGSFTIVERREGEDVAHVGEYLEIAKPARIVFKFGVPKYSPERDRVAVEIEPADGGSRVTITQDLNPGYAAFAASVEQGWRDILEGLAATLGPGPV